MEQRCAYAQFVFHYGHLWRAGMVAAEVDRSFSSGLVLHWRGAEEPRGSIYGAPRGEWRPGQPFHGVAAANQDDYHSCPPHRWTIVGSCAACRRWWWAVFPFER